MSNPAKTVFAFGCYMFLLGLTLLLVPNLLFGLFHIAATVEVWIRVVGMLVILLSVYYFVCARAEIRLFMLWSARVRGTVILFFSAFVLAGLAPPALLLLGAIDFAGALWTWSALRKEASLQPAHGA